MKENYRIIIIGAGISGISCGIRLKQLGIDDYIILEHDSRAGGLCQSFKFGPFYYDIGAHALHYKALENTNLDKVINTKEIDMQKRNAKIFIYNRFVPHPFQLHLYYLPLIKKINCIYYYLKRKNVIGPANLHDWLLSKFGKGICHEFLFPFNHKVWVSDELKKISINIAKRIKSESIRVLYGFLFKNQNNYSTNEYVGYPLNGGFENFLNNSIFQIKDKIFFSKQLISVDLKNKTITTKDNDNVGYDILINTIPIDKFIGMSQFPVGGVMYKNSRKLEKISICLVTFLTKKIFTEYQRIYVSEEKYFAQRIIINSNSSEAFKKANCSIVSLEISYRNKNLLATEKEVIHNCKQLLIDTGLLKSMSEIIEDKVDFFPYAYPLQSVGMERTIRDIKNYLGKYDCYTIGRFGEWNYENVDGMIVRAFDCIDDIIKKR